MDESYLKILQMIQDGAISAAEGERLLDALEAGAAAQVPEPTPAIKGPPEVPVEEALPAGPPAWWQRSWVFLLAAGFLVLAAGGIWTGNLISGGRQLGWLACAIPLLLLGALATWLIWWSRSARWLHVDVRDPEDHVKLSLPLPLHLGGWVLRVARPWVPRLREIELDEVVVALAEVESIPGNLLAVEVDDEEEGERVRVYIG